MSDIQEKGAFGWPKKGDWLACPKCGSGSVTLTGTTGLVHKGESRTPTPLLPRREMIICGSCNHYSTS